MNRMIPAAQTCSYRDLIWAAGLIEGEGTIATHFSTRTGIGLAVGQVDWWPIEKLVRNFGGLVYPVYRSNLTVPGSCQLRWCVHGSRAAGVMMSIYPLMSPRRQSSIKEALITWRTQRREGFCKNGHELTEENSYNAPGRIAPTRRCRICARAYYQRKNRKSGLADIDKARA